MASWSPQRQDINTSQAVVAATPNALRSYKGKQRRKAIVMENPMSPIEHNPTPNQPMERTLPRCALQRRSSAR